MEVRGSIGHRQAHRAIDYLGHCNFGGLLELTMIEPTTPEWHFAILGETTVAQALLGKT
jgi:hypothetical protein